MSLNCCHGLKRTDSDYDVNRRLIDDRSNANNISNMLRRKCLAERNWSGNLMPPPHDQKVGTRGDVSPRNLMAHHRRHETIGSAMPYLGENADYIDQPKLVRSGGIRRDWSFENLEAQLREDKRSKQKR